MSDRTYARFSAYVETELGIKMPDKKKTMLQSRLQKRLRLSGKKTFDEYYDYVFSPEGMQTELAPMVDVITTNKTDFFREPKHFDYLVQTALPQLIRSRGIGVQRAARIWSAGCSSGEEPYTLAMVLSEFRAIAPDFRFSILATDISTRMLDKVKRAVYAQEKAAPVSMAYKKKYLMRSRDRSRKLVRIVPELRSLVRFRQLNFMTADYGLRETMDIIFCRNVIIYFDRPTQEKVLNHLCRCLTRGGYIFMGHSETLNGLKVPLSPVAPTVYRKI
ncbi:chemotaxis protein methyltransferase [Desulfosarcina alkanivorans]|uniref:protein-glutamate O-methyltransferase n=1 Tax=Desulfosarcina alkanivorans TaxID=571177 RepID=A0A5K7YLA0_9BACT|nr:protein-glutamate O-methyltransferase [Desulfosarcina alkanivorans]BBO68970.1 chemotaxis protein methyltransferase [Desulfosarcina alkanivorans]